MQKNDIFFTKKCLFFNSLLYLICRVKELEDRKISPIFKPILSNVNDDLKKLIHEK